MTTKSAAERCTQLWTPGPYYYHHRFIPPAPCSEQRPNFPAISHPTVCDKVRDDFLPTPYRGRILLNISTYSVGTIYRRGLLDAQVARRDATSRRFCKAGDHDRSAPSPSCRPFVSARVRA